MAIVQSFEGNLVLAAYLVGLAAIFDFLDGFIARLLNVSSPIGKDLDSLADMVTFGVVPGIVMFQLIKLAVIDYHADYCGNDLPVYFSYLKYSAFIIPIFSAIRLAKFNNDSRQSDSFIGLPTPANAILICSLPLVLEYGSFDFSLNPYVFSIISFVLSILLISEIPLFALKFKDFKWKGNEIRYVFLALSLLLLVALQFIGIPLVIILYIVMSVIGNFTSKKIVS
jgi:CDP-diacylglycerol--serine O-phosphatidyltransferase